MDSVGLSHILAWTKKFLIFKEWTGSWSVLIKHDNKRVTPNLFLQLHLQLSCWEWIKMEVKVPTNLVLHSLEGFTAVKGVEKEWSANKDSPPHVVIGAAPGFVHLPPRWIQWTQGGEGGVKRQQRHRTQSIHWYTLMETQAMGEQKTSMLTENQKHFDHRQAL